MSSHNKSYIVETRLGSIVLTDSMGLASVNLMQLALKIAILCDVTRNDGHWAVQSHSRSPILIPIETHCKTLNVSVPFISQIS